MNNILVNGRSLYIIHNWNAKHISYTEFDAFYNGYTVAKFEIAKDSFLFRDFMRLQHAKASDLYDSIIFNFEGIKKL